jgi:hypothetical protein
VELQEKCNTLHRRIEAWREIQNIYMPGVQQLREASQPLSAQSFSPSSSTSQAWTSDTQTDSSSPTPNQLENTCLWLPSSMPQSLHLTGCTVGLAEKEIRLRLAQADDALNDLRRQLRISATLLDFKKTNIGGTSQRRGTRMHNLMTRFHEKSHRGAQRYDAAFQALSALDPNGA